MSGNGKSPEGAAAYTRSGLVLHFVKGSAFLFLLSIFCSMMVTLLQLYIPRVIEEAVDSLGSGGDLIASALLIIALALGAVLFRYGRISFNEQAAQTMMQAMRDELHRQILHLPLSWHQENATGDIIQRCTNDTDRINEFVSRQLTEVFRIVILIAVSFFHMFQMNLKLSFIAAVTIPVVVGYSLFFHVRIGKRFLVCDEEEGRLSTIAQENLTGIRVVHAFGRERFEQERFGRQNERYTNSWIDLMKLLSLFWGCGDLLSGIQVMLIIVFGSIFCVNGTLTPGQFIAFLSYNSMMVWPVRSLGRIISEMSKAGVSIDRIGYILNSPDEETAFAAGHPAAAEKTPFSGNDSASAGNTASNNNVSAAAGNTDLSGSHASSGQGSLLSAEKAAGLMRGDIEFDHVSFRFDDTLILKDVSFTIPGSSTFGILGATGSGKSTLMLLLDRLYDLPEDCGSIRIGGTDIRRIPLPVLRKQIGIVLQEPFLFSRTIAENISISHSSMPMEEIRRASDIAALDEAVNSFESGYDTVVGERGVTLSGGQKQRTAIARMLTQHAPVMVFDDSLSAVDAETDVRIREALKSRLSEATVILISHRVSTLMEADRILVMEQGRVAEWGSPEELYKNNGIYRRVCELQYAAGEVSHESE